MLAYRVVICQELSRPRSNSVLDHDQRVSEVKSSRIFLTAVFCDKIVFPEFEVGVRQTEVPNHNTLPSPITLHKWKDASRMASIAQKTFELANDITVIDPADEIFQYDADLQKRLDKEAPWTKEYGFLYVIRPLDRILTT